MLKLKTLLGEIRTGDWFVTVDWKLYQFQALSFGLALAPQTFCKYMDAAMVSSSLVISSATPGSPDLLAPSLVAGPLTPPWLFPLSVPWCLFSIWDPNWFFLP